MARSRPRCSRAAASGACRAYSSTCAGYAACWPDTPAAPPGTAHYDDVGLGTTGHAESVEIAFDPGELSYGELLQIYFSVAHDPTELDRQGPDSGSQYRSDIFYADETQRQIARATSRSSIGPRASAARW